MAQKELKADWYERRDELWPDQIFRMHDESIVKLDERVPGDGTQWYVLEWYNGSWSREDRRIEPGDLDERLADTWDKDHL